MNNFKRFWLVLRRTGALKVLFSFFLMCVGAAFIFKWVEPGINSIRDGIWYSFISSTTIGFGDFYATTMIGRVLTIFISLNGLIVFAIMTGVVVNYYTEYLNDKKKETTSKFLEKLENLPNLSKEELMEISEKVKKNRI